MNTAWASSVVALAIACLSVPLLAQNQDRRLPQTAFERQQALEIERELGLRAAAQFTGHYRRDNGWLFGGIVAALDYLTIAAAADVVAIGQARSHQALLSRDERDITSEFVVNLTEILRDTTGSLQNGASVIVSVPGGRVEFANGTSAEIRTPGFSSMQDGRRYLVALVRTHRDVPEGLSAEQLVNGRYQIGMSADGLIELSENGQAIYPSMPDKALIVERSGNPNVSTFMQRIRAGVREVNRRFPNRCLGLAC